MKGADDGVDHATGELAFILLYLHKCSATHLSIALIGGLHSFESLCRVLQTAIGKEAIV